MTEAVTAVTPKVNNISGSTFPGTAFSGHAAKVKIIPAAKAPAGPPVAKATAGPSASESLAAQIEKVRESLAASTKRNSVPTASPGLEYSDAKVPAAPPGLEPPAAEAAACCRLDPDASCRATSAR